MLRLRFFKSLLQKNHHHRHLATATRSLWSRTTTASTTSTWRRSPGCFSRSGTTPCGARRLGTVFWRDLLCSLGGLTIKVWL